MEYTVAMKDCITEHQEYYGELFSGGEKEKEEDVNEDEDGDEDDIDEASEAADEDIEEKSRKALLDLK